VNHVFARFGVTEAFPSQSLNGGGVLHGPQVSLQFFASFQFLLYFAVKKQFVTAQALIFADDRLVPEKNAHKTGDDQ